MLQRAAMLYGGEIDVVGRSIIQGSYSNNSADNLGTHLGGGAVDISVMRTNTQYILYSDIDPLIRALRTVGFAAWLREDGEGEFETFGFVDGHQLDGTRIGRIGGGFAFAETDVAQGLDIGEEVGEADEA